MQNNVLSLVDFFSRSVSRLRPLSAGKKKRTANKYKCVHVDLLEWAIFYPSLLILST